MFAAYIMIAEIAKPQGVRGEIKLRPVTCDVSRFEGLKQVFLADGEDYAPRGIRVTRIEPDAVYAYLDGVTDRNGAEALRGRQVFVDRKHAVKLDGDSDFICDLIGLTGETTGGRTIGEIKDVLQPGGTDVYVFKKGRTETLVPALKSVVVRVDYAAGKMILDEIRLGEVSVTNED